VIPPPLQLPAIEVAARCCHRVTLRSIAPPDSAAKNIQRDNHPGERRRKANLQKTFLSNLERVRLVSGSQPIQRAPEFMASFCVQMIRVQFVALGLTHNLYSRCARDFITRRIGLRADVESEPLGTCQLPDEIF